MKDDNHGEILAALQKSGPDFAGIHRLIFPTAPVIGSYKPDFLWFIDSQGGHLSIIGEVEASDFANKDIPGACLLADNLACRIPCVQEPLLAFVVPDEIVPQDFGHVEERLNIASSRMKKITILPAMKATDFIIWFKRKCLYEEQRSLRDHQNDRPSEFS